MPEPFTPEQEARIRAIVRELIEAPAFVKGIRDGLNQLSIQSESVFGAGMSEALRRIGSPPESSPQK